MLHENRASYNHRGLAARQAKAAEAPPRTTAKAVVKPTRVATKSVPAKVTPTPAVKVTAASTPLAVDPSSNPVAPIALSTSSTSAALPLTTTTPSPIPIISPSTSIPVKVVTTTASVKSKAATVKSSAHSTATAAAAAAAKESGGSNAGAVAGGVVGGLLGAGLLAALLIFLIKRYRKKSMDGLTFNASKFRRSALLLNDPPVPPEKNVTMQQQQARPSPQLTMAARPVAPSIPPPSAAVPYGDHNMHSADPYGQYAANAAQYNVGMYGADGQIARDPYADVYGTGAAPSMFGQHVPYGKAAQYGAPPMQQQFPQQPYQHYPQQYQSSFGPGNGLPQNVETLPNPFSNNVTSASTAPSAASAGSPMPSGSVSSRSYSSGDDDDIVSPATYLRRQPTQSSGAPPAYEANAHYADIQRDVKVAPGALSVVNAAHTTAGTSTSPSTPSTPTIPVAKTSNNAVPDTKRMRPTSSYTLYDDEDAYGGM